MRSGETIPDDEAPGLTCLKNDAPPRKRRGVLALHLIRNAVNFIPQAVQDGLKPLPINIGVAGGQLRQEQHLPEGGLNLRQGAVQGLNGGGIQFFRFVFLWG